MTAARLVVLDAAVLDRLRTEQLRDAIDDAAAHALVATSPGARNRLRASPAVPDDLPILLVAGGGPTSGSRSSTGGSPPTADSPSADGADATADGTDSTAVDPTVHRFGDVAVAVATSDAELAAIGRRIGSGSIDAAHAYVLTDRLSLSIRPTELETSIEGLAAYRAALAAGATGADDGADAEGTTRGDDAAGGDDATRAAETTNADEPAAIDRKRCTHVSTALPSDYCAEHHGLVLRGASPTDEEREAALGGTSGEPAVVALACGPDGAVGARELGPDALGLRAVRGVGRKRVAALQRAGVETRAALAEAGLAALADCEGVGRGTARRLREHARAHEDGRVVRRGDGTLPEREPVFVDVETDGLSPSIVWLVGALDRRGEERYMSFLARDPDEPGAPLSAFCSWYFANAADRPLVAYNGWSFDFPVLEAQIERHCPEHLEDWQSAWRVDPYAWAVRDGNAVLPGRTNALEDVAAALGYESAVDHGVAVGGGAATDDGGTAAVDGGATAADGDGAADDESTPDAKGDAHAGAPKPLTGAEVGRRYRRWIRERTPDAEPDWERLEAYCEDDVRGLAHVYDALRDADRTAGRATAGGDGASTGAGETTQGQLGDF